MKDYYKMSYKIDEPKHHRRYRVAWESFTDPDTSEHCKKPLMKEMDDAQNDFEWDEWNIFKATLKVGYWDGDDKWKYCSWDGLSTKDCICRKKEVEND